MYASNDTQSRQNSNLSELHLERAQAAATGMGNANGNGNGDWSGVKWSGVDSRQQAIIDRTDMNKDNGRVAILHFCIRNENK